MWGSENKIKVVKDYLIINDTLIKINDICLIRPNRNQSMGGIEILLTGKGFITIYNIGMIELKSHLPLPMINDFFINISKITAVFPIPKPRTYPGTYVYFEGTEKIDLPFIESNYIIDEILG